MPRDGSGIYTQPFPNVVDGTTIESAVYNGFTTDVTTDLNTPRPVVAGGTGASSADQALFNIAAEKAAQVVTNYDSHVFLPGSFRSAAGATSAPNSTHAFAGTAVIGEALANPPTNQNVVVEARDLGDTVSPGRKYVREKKAGVWGSWGEGVYAAGLDAQAYSGMQVNGSMEISQEKGSSTLTTASGEYICDGYRIYKNGTMAFSAGASQVAPIVSGIQGVLFVTVSTAQTSIGGGDYLVINHPIEGYRISRLAWGTGSAQPVTIGFWSRHHRTGVYSVNVSNGSRSYCTSYTHNGVDVSQFNTITIPGDTSGTWGTTNNTGLTIQFVIASGVVTPSANTWQAAAYQAAPGQVNGVGATSDVFRITGIVVLPGTQAPSATQSPLIMRPYDQELVTCKRYWQKLGDAANVDVIVGGYGVAGSTFAQTLIFPEMRANPTGTIVGTWFVSNCAQPTISSAPGARSLGLQTTVTAAGSAFFYTQGAGNYISLDARL